MTKATEKQEEKQELAIEQKLKNQIDYLESEMKRTELTYNQLLGSLNLAKALLDDLTKPE